MLEYDEVDDSWVPLIIVYGLLLVVVVLIPVGVWMSVGWKGFANSLLWWTYIGIAWYRDGGEHPGRL